MSRITEKEFAVLKRAARNISNARKVMREGQAAAGSLPSILGFKLTNRCNLRCRHCYEWNDKGYHHNMNGQVRDMDLDFAIFEKCIEETRETAPFVYLWGGEPLFYSNIERVLRILAQERLTTAICTNGIAILDRMEELIALSEGLELLIALDGDEQANDALRGKGTFQKVMAALDALQQERVKGRFQGKISIHTMVSNENAGGLLSYVAMLERKGIDSLVLCLPWYISEETSLEMDRFFKEQFDWLKTGPDEQVKSWHSFKYRLEPDRIAEIRELLYRVLEQDWQMTVRLQPDIEKGLFEDFLNGRSVCPDSRQTCLSVASRMDVLPSGKVTSCKHFPEFSLGDLAHSSVREIWNSEEMNRVRAILHQHVMPVCTKCNNFYLHGYKAKTNQP